MNNLTHDNGEPYTIDGLAYILVNDKTTFCTRSMLKLISKHEMSYDEADKFIEHIYWYVAQALVAS